ncbi:efflux RND transporter periplasmic adaptor subunit [Massilia sp. BJB1822]|uniref:efflux RND transporter periplasmic adaptor subunit n=1 Tax=Massilia sp. BJB1822 TaxID=2744470 RepID=UPI001592DF4B|nr:efflux RND transporter periplasmic adaptor subunit [Massilia sp. BJB1822]NVE00642.1 efflux RND transporter periplasmic adaptor subunit [Massilia sp. BJB1822]
MGDQNNLREKVASLESRSGAGMDRKIARRPFYRHHARLLLAGLGVVALLLGFSVLMPRGQAIDGKELLTAEVTHGVFLDEALVRSTVSPLSSVILDSVETGRVEEVFVRDGSLVKQNEKLFRLSNPQRRLDLLARESDYAQQISNLSNLQTVFETGRIDHKRRLTSLKFSLSQAEKKYRRDTVLARNGFISEVALDESLDKVAEVREQLTEEARSAEIDEKIKSDALRQVQKAISSLDSGLGIVRESVDALSVTAPRNGRLTDFNLQVGQVVKSDQHIGRIDDPEKVKLMAEVDEFYLPRLGIDRAASVQLDGRERMLKVSRIFPQIKDGKFSVELLFSEAQNVALSPGQSIDVRISLGVPASGTIIPNGAYLNQTGGAWVFVVAPDGKSAERREVSIGRRNPRQVEVKKGLQPGERILVSSYSKWLEISKLLISK